MTQFKELSICKKRKKLEGRNKEKNIAGKITRLKLLIFFESPPWSSFFRASKMEIWGSYCWKPLMWGTLTGPIWLSLLHTHYLSRTNLCMLNPLIIQHVATSTPFCAEQHSLLDLEFIKGSLDCSAVSYLTRFDISKPLVMKIILAVLLIFMILNQLLND